MKSCDYFLDALQTYGTDLTGMVYNETSKRAIVTDTFDQSFDVIKDNPLHAKGLNGAIFAIVKRRRRRSQLRWFLC